MTGRILRAPLGCGCGALSQQDFVGILGKTEHPGWVRQEMGNGEPKGFSFSREDRQAEVDCVTERNRNQLQGNGPSLTLTDQQSGGPQGRQDGVLKPRSEG